MSVLIRRSLKEGLATWKEYKGMATLFFLTFIVIMTIPSFLAVTLFPALLGEESIPGILLVQLVHFLAMSLAWMGWIWVNLKMTAKEPVQWSDYFSPIDRFLSFIGGSFLYSILMAIITSILFVILLSLTWWGLDLLTQMKPANLDNAAIGISILATFFFTLYVSIIFCFWPYFLLGGPSTILESFRESRRATRGYRFRLILLSLILMLINFIGALVLIIGLLFSVPVTALAITQAFRILQSHKALVDN